MRWTILALLLLGFARAGIAATEAEYRAERARVTLAPVTHPTQVTEQLAALAGRAVELEGVINGTFASSDGTGYLLRTPGPQVFILQSRRADAVIELGNAVRVLARVPREGSVLESLAVIFTDPDRAGSAMAPALTDDMPVAERYPSIYDTTPDLDPPKQMDARQYQFTEKGMAQNPEIVRLYAEKIREFNTRLDADLASRIAFHILEKSEQHGIDARLTMALIARESRFNPRAVSPKGAMGLGQLMPGTAAGLGVKNAFDVESNIDGTVRYLAGQMESFGRLSLALAAYNAGPGAVRRYGSVPPYRETRNYVRLVWETYAELAGVDPNTGERIAAR